MLFWKKRIATVVGAWGGRGLECDKAGVCWLLEHTLGANRKNPNLIMPYKAPRTCTYVWAAVYINPDACVLSARTYM